MNPPMAPHQQVQGGGVQQQGFYPSQVPQQLQNASQQRQIPTTQQKGTSGQQQSRTIPQLSFWTFEKPSQSTTWDDVKPRKEYISQEELREKLTKFKRKDETVTDCLDATRSRSCRAEIRNFVEDENAKLRLQNKPGEYIIAGMILGDYRSVRNKDKQKYPYRVQVILQIEESSLQDPHNSKSNAGGMGNAQGVQDANKAMKGGNPIGQQQHGNMQGQSANMGQQSRPNPQQVQHQQQQHPGQGQPFDQRLPPLPNGHNQMHPGGNAPPPPPPPPGHPGGNAPPPPPPPPPPPGGHANQFGQQQKQQQQQHSQMRNIPGSYPGTPVNGMRHSQPDIRIMNDHKQNRKSHPGKSSDEEWDTEGSSSSDPWQTHSVSDDFAYLEERGRGRSKPSHHGKKFVHKSKSRVRSRSVSQRRRQSNRPRRDSDSSDNRSHTKPVYASSSSDDGRRGKKFDRWVRPSPTRAYNIKATGRSSPSSPMSRRSSQDSWTDATSSIYSNDRDRRDRVDDRTRTHSRTRYDYHKPSIKRYNTVHYHNVREVPNANDYPHNPLHHHAQDPYAGGLGLGSSRPIPQRAATLPQMPIYDTGNAHLLQGGGLHGKNYAYAQQAPGYMPTQGYGQQQPNYMPNTAAILPNRYSLEELSTLLEQFNLNKQRSSLGPNRYTMDELSVLLSQLNSDRQRASAGEHRITMDELVVLLDQLNNERQYSKEPRMPLKRHNTDRMNTGYYGHQSEQRRQGYLDDEYTDARYATRGAVYDR